MGILSGALSARRFRVVGAVPDDFRERYKVTLDEQAFREPLTPQGKEEVEGWCSIHNMLDTSFEDVDQWLYETTAVFALRVDKKALPQKLFRATLEKRCAAWCAEHNVSRCPRSVKEELGEELEAEWLRRALPRVTVVEAAWDMASGLVLLHSGSEGVADRFRRRFFRTFGFELVPWSPLDYLGDPALVTAMAATGPSLIADLEEAR